MHPLTIIFSFVVIASIVVFGFTALMQKRQLAYKERKDALDREAAMKMEGDSDAQREVLELRERIKVLERIATDANSTESLELKAISAEIEKLRDK